jgi:hypothetical protein
MIAFRAHDRVRLSYRRWVVEAEVVLASDNGMSLLLTFEALLGKHAGAMPVLFEDGGFRSIIDGAPVTLSKMEDTDDDTAV